MNDFADPGAEIGVGVSAAHAADQIVVDLGKEAGADLAVGGETDPAAVAAEGMRDGGDDADFAEAVVEGEAAGGFGEVVGGQRDERTHGVEAGDDLFQRDDCVRRPVACAGGVGGFFEGHELDEAEDDSFVAGEVGEGFDLRIVEAAEKDAVDLDGAESGVLGGVDAVEDALEAVGDAGYSVKGFGVDGVHADGDAGEAGVFEGLREAGEVEAVGGEGDVEWIGGEGRMEFRGGTDEVEEAIAEERLAAGEANFLDAERDEEAKDAGVVVEGELGGLGSAGPGAAVDAAEVAAAGDGEAEVGEGAAVAVDQARFRGNGGGRCGIENGDGGYAHGG